MDKLSTVPSAHMGEGNKIIKTNESLHQLYMYEFI